MTASVNHPMPWQCPDACALDYGRLPSDSNLKDHLEPRNQPCAPRMSDTYAQQTHLPVGLDGPSCVFGSIQICDLLSLALCFQNYDADSVPALMAKSTRRQIHQRYSAQVPRVELKVIQEVLTDHDGTSTR